MRKIQPLPVDFAFQDMQELFLMAGFTFQAPREVDFDYLDRVEKNRQLPPCPKLQKDVDKAIRVVLAYLIWVIRDDALEGKVQP